MLQCKDCGKYIRSIDHANYFREWFRSVVEQRCMVRPKTVGYGVQGYYYSPFYCGECIDKMKYTWRKENDKKSKSKNQ